MRNYRHFLSNFQRSFPLYTLKVFVLGTVSFLSLINQGASEGYNKYRNFGTLHTMENLIHWSNKESELVILFRDRLDQLQRQKDIIVKYQKSYKSSSAKALDNVREAGLSKHDRGKVIGSSMVLSHIMTNRYANAVDKLKNLLESSQYQKPQRDLQTILKISGNKDEEATENFLLFMGILKNHTSSKIPNWEDLYLSHMAFMQIQAIYDSRPDELRFGFPIGTNFGGELKASHCAKLGMYALEGKPFYYIAIEWLELGIKLIELGDDSFPKDIMENMLKEAIQLHNSVHESGKRLVDIDVFMDTYSNPVVLPSRHSSKWMAGRDVVYRFYSNLTGNSSNEDARFMGLCSGEVFQTPKEQSSLKCYLERKRHPYFILNPVKTEQLSEYPYLVKMYNVLGNETIERILKDRAYRSLSSIASFTDFPKSLEQRSSISFLFSNLSLEEEIDKKSEMLTGLKIDPYDEPGQIAEYVYGRYYGQHTDPFQDEELKTRKRLDEGTGNRLATVIYYLQEPDLGGYTSFIQVGAYSEIKNSKGSALFWINLYKNGTSRQDVVHGACPVIHGSKISGLGILPTFIASLAP